MIDHVSQLGDCVVDASILAKLFLPEVDADLADSLMRNTGPSPLPLRAAPDLALYECANILWKWLRRGRVDATFAEESVTDLLALPLKLWPAASLIGPSMALAHKHDITIYDASYVALAQLLGIPLVTADEALMRKVGGPTVRLLSSFTR